MRQMPRMQYNGASNSIFLMGCLLLLIQVGCKFESSSPDSSKGWSGGGTDPMPPTIPPTIGSPDPSTIRFIPIRGGTSRLGSLKSEPGRNATLERIKTVSVDRIDMSWSEITRAQWYAIMDPKRTVRVIEANWPITNITYHEAAQFCQILTIKTGVLHRLPTEAEWEYAARAGSEEMLSTWKGNCSISEAITSYHRGDSGKLYRGIKVSCNIDSGKILPVGQFSASPFGLVDMHGNCWEWVSLEDCLTAPPSPLHAPIRGGSAISTNPLEARSANRAWQPMSQPAMAIGFRVVREVSK